MSAPPFKQGGNRTPWSSTPRSAPRHGSIPSRPTGGDLGDDFDHEPLAPEQEDDERDIHERRSGSSKRGDEWPEGPADNVKALMESMRRMAAATESTAIFETQCDIYKDLNLLHLQYEMASNPTVGVVRAMLPTVYHIYGVKGHLPPITMQMTGPTRYRTTMDYLYYEAPWTDPRLLMDLRMKLTPRLLMVLTFGIFKGTMAFHLSDITLAPENSLLEMSSPSFHLSGKTLPTSGLTKLTAPDPSKLTTNFSALWELMESFVNLFCLIYGIGHRLPLTTLIQDLKDIQRRDYGITTGEMADLFSRILGAHQDDIISAFTVSGGLLTHIKSQEDLLSEAARSDVSTDLMCRLVPWPSLAPGSKAYDSFYKGPREFMHRFHRDLSVKKLREDTVASRGK